MSAVAPSPQEDKRHLLIAEGSTECGWVAGTSDTGSAGLFADSDWAGSGRSIPASMCIGPGNW